jgi:hypothetical protein
VDIRMPSNVLNSLVEYTTLRVDPVERIVALSDPKMLEAPFCYFAGHKLVQFTAAERKNLERYIKGGGFLFVDDCNHDIDGLLRNRSRPKSPASSGRRRCTRSPTIIRSIRASSSSMARRIPRWS